MNFELHVISDGMPFIAYDGFAEHAVPHKPIGYTNLVNSLRWTAMVHKVGGKSDSGVVVEDTASNALAQNIESRTSERRLLDASYTAVAGENFDSHSSSAFYSGSDTLTPLLDPEDAYRTVICIATLFGLIAAFHSRMSFQSGFAVLLASVLTACKAVDLFCDTCSWFLCLSVETGCANICDIVLRSHSIEGHSIKGGT